MPADSDWKAYADGISSSNLIKALNHGGSKTARAASPQEPKAVPKQHLSPQSNASKSADPDLSKTK